MGDVQNPGTVLLVTYWTVLLAELVGDKSLYTIASLASRHRWRPVALGVSLAFSGKMLVAVALGDVMAHLSQRWLAAASAATFFATALMLWNLRATKTGSPMPPASRFGTAFGVSFCAIFFTEWGDFGQIAAAVLTAQSQAPVITWLGGTAAMLTKGALALTLGVKLRNYLPSRTMRYLATASCAVLGSLALAEAIWR